MKNPDFTTMSYRDIWPVPTLSQWQERAEQEAGQPLSELVWHTMEQIDVRPLYTAADLTGLEHLGFTAGLPP